MLNSDIVVAEVSTPSIGVGYEIGRAVAAGIFVIALYKIGPTKPLSAMIAGAPSDCVVVLMYREIEEIRDKLKKVITKRI